MRLLCVSDVVDKYLYNSDDAIKIKPDLIISCGDLPRDYLEFLVSKFNVPLLFVQGNHDNYDAIESRKEGVLELIGASKFDFKSKYDYTRSLAGMEIDNKVVVLNKLIFLGFEGCNRYNNGRHQYTQKEMFRKVRKTYFRLFVNKIIYNSYVDVVVSHAPPYGIHDRNDVVHTGFKAFLELIEKFRPKYLLHGHVHIYDNRESRVFEYKGTKIINCYGYYILDL
ncbi:MAG: metallophosphoesterase [Spirochaetia bacterium]|nr:metallophosphoesterase [Spirochaetota bacterium]MCX8097355.1 metallophosphoesterase [Spirochaetota bacterium]MDW8112006.1 metallophosphoesterase [Spirochaetia bacterium]